MGGLGHQKIPTRVESGCRRVLAWWRHHGYREWGLRRGNERHLPGARAKSSRT
jgi:hypothetical protein